MRDKPSLLAVNLLLWRAFERLGARYLLLSTFARFTVPIRTIMIISSVYHIRSSRKRHKDKGKDDLIFVFD